MLRLVSSSVLAFLFFSLAPSQAHACGPGGPYRYAGCDYPTLAEAEEVLRGIRDTGGDLTDRDWDVYFELKGQPQKTPTGLQYNYEADPRPHLPSPAYIGTRIKKWQWGWQKIESQYMSTFAEAESWTFTEALKPIGSYPFTADNPVFHYQITYPNTDTAWYYSQNYTDVPLSYYDTAYWNVWDSCSDFTSGVEETRGSPRGLSIYRDKTTPAPTGVAAFHAHCTVGANTNGWAVISIPMIVVASRFVSVCQSPYTSDGLQCVNSEQRVITYTGSMYTNGVDPQPQECTETNPCNPADGSKTQTEIDVAKGADGALSFARYYRSAGSVKSDASFAPGWRHSYSRALDEEPDVAPTLSFAAPVDQSQMYSSASDACTSGWDDIKADLWNGDLSTGTATFMGGNTCKIEVGGVTKAYTAIRAVTGFAGFTPASNIKKISRPNGSVEVFELDGASWVNKLDPSVTLEEVSGNWIYTDRSDTKETYNGSGQLLSIEYRNGQTETLTYNLTVAQGGDDNSATLDKVTGPFGHTLSFSYDVNAKLESVTFPDGSIDYGYDANGNLQTVTNPDLSVKTYHYEDSSLPNHLTGITDEESQRFATWAYDTSGRAILSEHAGGKESVQLTYNADDTTTLTLADGATRTYHYSTQQGERKLQMLVGSVCSSCPNGDIADKVYDANGFLDEVQDWQGNLTQTIRNGRGLTETLIEAKGSLVERTTTTVWHANYRLPTVVTSPKNTTTYTHDADGNIEDITVASGALSRSWGMTYNANGQVETIDGPRTDVVDVTTIAYHNCTTGNECGQVNTITNALGHVTTYNTYDAAGRPTLITDPNGLQTSMTYDWRGNVLTVTQTPTAGTPRTTTMTYDDIGQMKTVSTPDGMVLTYDYTPARYLESVQDNLGNKIAYDYDSMGNVIDEDVTDPGSVLRRATDYAYDLNRQLDTITHGGYTTDVTIDLVGNLTNTVDPKLASTQNFYDALNRLDSTTDALLGVTDYIYDDHDNLTDVIAPNNATTTYIYNDLDDLTTEISPDRGTTTYTYDSAGNLKTKLDARGKLTTYDYDALNRLTLETLDDGSTIAYEYDVGTDAIGRMNKITDPTGSTSWTFDKFGAVDGKDQVIGGVTLSTSYTYDAQGRVDTMTYPSGKVLSYGYNTYQLSSISVDGVTLLSNATYEPFGPSNGWTWGDSSVADRDFDLRGLTTAIDYAGATQTIGYDAGGYLTSHTGAGVSATYDYDLLGRITDYTNGLGGGPSSPPGPMFSSTPAVLATIQTANNETGTPAAGNPTPWMTSVMRNVSASGVELALGRAEVNTGSITVDESIGYVAIEGGASGSFIANSATVFYESQTTTDSVRGWGNGCYTTNFLTAFSASPLVVGTMNRLDGGDGGWARRCSLSTSAVGFTIDEDQYADTERNHTTESVGFAAFSQEFDATFTDVTGTWKMEVASSTLADTAVDPSFKTINFRQTYSSAPIVVVLATDETSDPAAIRIRNVTATSFEAVQVEPANNDGTQGAMTLHYLAIDAGQHELPDGTRISAALVSLQNQQHGNGVTGAESWHSETFSDWPGGGSSLPGALEYDYDANGNRTLLTEDSVPYSFTVQTNSNRLQSTAGPVAKTYSYDLAGNVIGDGTHTYGYNDRGRLISVDGSFATYAHNGQGQRVSKTVSVTTLFAYDEGGSLIGQYDSAGVADQEFVWFDGAPVGVLSGLDVLYIHTDQIGTPRVVTDGSVDLWRWDSTPFGVGAANEDVDGDGIDLVFDLRFSGQYSDSETGFNYNYFRTYDPLTGRYLESDPIGLFGGTNTYAYVGANPKQYTDPQGLLAWCAAGPFGVAFCIGQALNAVHKAFHVARAARAAHIAATAVTSGTVLSGDQSLMTTHDDDDNRSDPGAAATSATVFYTCPLVSTNGNMCLYECDDGTYTLPSSTDPSGYCRADEGCRPWIIKHQGVRLGDIDWWKGIGGR